jgi:transposase-like protein
MSILSASRFHNEEAAFAWVEDLLWPKGPVCFHCGCMDHITTVKPNPEKRVRYGLKRCGDCKKQFTVRMGTIFEESKLPLRIWLQAMHLMASSKKGVSAHQLHRTLEITYKSAWFLAHRIRESMREGELAPFGMGGATVEVDETYFGRDPDSGVPEGKAIRGGAHMMKVLSPVERESGRARSFVVDRMDTNTVIPIVEANLSRETRLRTDESSLYKTIGKYYREHETVNHSREEYVRKNDFTVHTNTIEGFFSIFKREMKGTYQHCSKKHLHRFLAEFDFRYSYRVALGVDDQARVTHALKGVVGKRLTYRRTDRWGPEAAARA